MYRILAFAVLAAVVFTFAVTPASYAEPLLLCGAETVFEIDTATAAGGTIEKTWVWDARQCKDLPEEVRGTFRTTDDCKPLDGGAKVLVSSSSGGCALVERPSGKALWYAVVANAHSIAMLPHNRIVVASSTNARGNRLVLFDLATSNRPIWDTPLVSAHGVVWDADRQVLWALGFDELQCYELQDWQSDTPSMKKTAVYRLPDPSGHDLQAVPGSDDLVVTSGKHVYLFDRSALAFRLHPELADRVNMKSVCIHPKTGQTVFVQATESWWSDQFGLLSPADTVRLPGERLYKARWLATETAE